MDAHVRPFQELETGRAKINGSLGCRCRVCDHTCRARTAGAVVTHLNIPATGLESGFDNVAHRTPWARRARTPEYRTFRGVTTLLLCPKLGDKQPHADNDRRNRMS